MKRRFVSLWFPRLPCDRLIRAGAPADRPLATLVETGNRILLAAVNRAAEQAGLAPGMTLADARAVTAALLAVPAEPRAEAALLARLGRWCMRRYTPLAAVCGADGLALEVTGCAHLFGGEAAMLADMAGRLRRLGFGVSGALADTRGAAWALARFAAPGTIAPPGCLARALERLPVAALGVNRETAAGLGHLGLRRVGDLYGMARGSLAARFGMATLLRLDRALGHAPEPLATLRQCRPRRVRFGFTEPIGTRADIDAALARLLDRLCARLERDGRGARRLELEFRRVDNTAQTLAVGAVRPLREAAVMARLFADRLDRVDPGFGIEAMLLSAPATEEVDPAQPRLDEARDGPAADALAGLVERLGNRYGFETVVRPLAVASHLPDRAWRAVPAARTAGTAWPKGPPRPLRLFREPVPVAAEADGDGPPDSFRWRGRRHVLRAVVGPERIAPEWWRDEPAWGGGARDYWRVEDTDGRRFWLCRMGHPPQWRLHGLFG